MTTCKQADKRGNHMFSATDRIFSQLQQIDQFKKIKIGDFYNPSIFSIMAKC